MGGNNPGPFSTNEGLFGNTSSIHAGSAPTTTATTDEILNQYLKYLPQLTSLLNSSSVDSAKAQTPGLNALGVQQLQQYGVPYAKAGNAITAENAQAGADINRTLLTGTGAANARTASALDKEINPTLYNARDKSNKLLESINLNGLSGGERAEVERALGKSQTATGNLGLDNATNAVSNAMSYGDRLAQKRQELNQYVNTGLNASQGGVNASGIALSGTQAPQTNFGTGQFAGNTSTQNAINNNASLGTSLLGNLSQVGGASIAPAGEASWKNSDRYALDQMGANS